MKMVKAIVALIGGIMIVVTTIKNVIDMVLDLILFLGDVVVTGLKLFVEEMWDNLRRAVSGFIDQLPETPFTNAIKKFGSDINPDSPRAWRKFTYEHLADDKTEDLYRVMKSYVEGTAITGRFSSLNSVLSQPVIDGLVSALYPLVKADKNWIYEGNTPAEREESRRVGRIIGFGKFEASVKYGMNEALGSGEFMNSDFANAMRVFAQVTGTRVGDYTRDNYRARQAKEGVLGYLDLEGKVKQDIKDVTDTAEAMQEAYNSVDAALDKTQNPMIDKQIADNTKETAANTGKTAAAVSEKIVDILKEIAGVTVINKQTMVRPDLVFNFGSYGRSGSGELSNYVGNGEISAGPAFTEEQLRALSKWTKNAIDRLFGRGGANVDSTVEIYNGEAR